MRLLNEGYSMRMRNHRGTVLLSNPKQEYAL